MECSIRGSDDGGDDGGQEGHSQILTQIDVSSEDEETEGRDNTPRVWTEWRDILQTQENFVLLNSKRKNPQPIITRTTLRFSRRN